MKKLLIVLLSIVIISFNVYAEDSFDDFSDDMSSFFEDVEDTNGPVIVEKNQASGLLGTILDTIKLSGHLDATLGVLFQMQGLSKDNMTFLPVFDFNNYLYLTTNINNIFSFRTSVLTNLSTLQSTAGITLNEIYFDYLLLNRIYLTAGKKSYTWGYIRLFSDATEYGTGFDARGNAYAGNLHTDIMTNSINRISAQIRIPVWTGTITGLGLYNYNLLSAGLPSASDFAFAGSIEMILGHTSVNLFGRTYASEDNSNPVVGVEAKRTIFGADIYGQGLMKIKYKENSSTNIDNYIYGYMLNYVTYNELQEKMTEMYNTTVSEYLYNNRFYEKIIATGGFYRTWETADPTIGVNFEYQYIYTPSTGVHDSRIALQFGLKNIGLKDKVNLGVLFHYNFVQASGNVKLAFSISNIVPALDWTSGFECHFGPYYGNVPKLLFTTYLKLNVDY